MSSFNATWRSGPTYYLPQGLAYDSAYLWAGYDDYVASWETRGLRRKTFYVNGGINYDAAYDRGRDLLYVINKTAGVYRVLTLNPATGSITNSFTVPPAFPSPLGLAYGAGYLHLADLNRNYLLRLTTTGSVVGSYNTGVAGISGLAWDGDTAGGPYLFACVKDGVHTILRINPSHGSVTKSFAGPRFAGDILGLAWDGSYLWACRNDMGRDMYAYRFVAHDPNPYVAPASLGKIKALYR